ncbi:GAF domain-containing protein [Mycolicibacterium sp. 050158]|uniref:GAF domain-containing protein n=1 Tax=Mycolicibacterium sp. 050158 TaxID=3090602 RepID=UPI00299D8DFF|nr:GAF domain-containing protein [Mycolicibacterium sp. 050158]MDX1890774.1 GAF domain-containing protein [Mycolicibacterium sp. 050158]
MNDRRSGKSFVDERFGDHETARQFIVANADENPAFRELMGQLAGEPDAVARLVKSVLTDTDRLNALHDTGLMDGAPRMALDQFAALTAEALGIPFAALSLVDQHRQVLIGCNCGTDSFERSRPLELSICKYTVASGQPLVIDDTTAHPLLVDHPMVVNGSIRAYAGVPLRDGSGNAVGTLCAWDDHPRRWTGGQVQILEDLASAARAKVFDE